MNIYRILKITNTCLSTNKKTYYVLEKKGWFGWKRLAKKWVETCYYQTWSYFFKDVSVSFTTIEEAKKYFNKTVYRDKIKLTTEEIIATTTTKF